MIQTKYKTNIEINEESFSVIVRDMSVKERQKFEIRAEDKIAPYKKQTENEKRKEEIDAELEETTNALEINNELIKEGKLTDKISLLLESKKLNSQIALLKKERLTIKDADIKGIINAFEELAKERFELLVEGEDKIALAKSCEQNGVSYTTLWEEITKEANKEREKK